MTQPFRTPAGGRIDRAQPLDFSFDGRTWSGYRGDTLASALLANGVHLVARSFKYHRPRGILSAGAEEPNALVQLGRGARTEPNLRATQIELYAGLCAASQNRWPSLRFDLGAVSGRLSALLPAGFYYKTFMRPAGWWPGYEGLIRRAAGVGRAPGLPDPDRYDARHEHCDVLVVGGGPAGLSAALAAGRSGARVMVADEQLEFGGQLLDERGDDGTVPFAGTALAELASLPRVRLLTRTTISGYYDHNFLVGVERVTDHLGPGPHGATPRQRLWKIRARQVVLATGALERPLVFADNDRPGIMLAGAVRAYLNRFGVRCGTRAVVVAGTDEACRSALDLADAGIDVAAVVRLRGAADERLAQALRGRGIELLDSPRVIAAVGTKRVEALAVAASEGGPVREIACDLVCMSAGWAPNVSLFSQSRGTLRYDAALAAYVPGRSAQAERSAGACAGALTLAQCLNGGYAAGADAARAAGFAVDRGEPHPGGVAPRAPGDAPPQAPDRYARPGRSFVDFHNDVTVADVELAAREGYAAVEHLKRYTTLGMGPDQGKTANLNALALLAGLRGVGIPELGHTTFRPPYTPITLGAIAGRKAGALFDPVRRTPLHDWHAARGAVFEPVGQWLRPRYYPRAGESMADAVARECLAARRSVGMLDASTLGKIDIRGADAGEFLDRVYVNRFSTLGAGRCRYGLMLRLDGMVFDDGVTTRLAADHFLMSTTSGGAGAVLAWLEEWLQTEWPQLRVYCTSVTEQYAIVALAGPRSRELLARVTRGIAFDDAAFPFMSVREGEVAGIDARVFRISFSGGPGYEVAVAAGRGQALWNALLEAGRECDITPYGTEAMHVLRAEAGFIIAGQETDGTVTPDDLGLGRLVARDKTFIGARSLSRPDSVRPDRKQLVGLLTDEPRTVLPEGAQIVAEAKAVVPMPMIGHVTSSYFSANAGRSIALALIAGGRERIGETVYAPLPQGTLRVRVTEPNFRSLLGSGG